MKENKLRKKRYLVTVFLLAGLVLVGCRQEKTQAMTPQGPAAVEVMTVTPQPVELAVELPGRTAAYRVAEVRPQVNGIIQKRLFEEGSEVAAGQLLYQIDPAVYQARLDSATAALAKARAVEDLARLKAERYRTLVRTKAVSELEQVEIEASWKQAVAEVAAAEAAVGSARIDLEYTRVKAPIGGRIGRSMVSEGALVTAQQSTPLATIQQLDPLYVDVSQSSLELLRLKKELSGERPGEADEVKPQVHVLLEDGSEYDQPGLLEFSDVTVDQTTGAIILRAVVANPERELLPGMFVRTRIVSGLKANGILVPAASISRNNKGQATVLVVDGESKVESRIIESGRNIGDQVMVEEGLVGGEILITAGLQKVRPGAEVKTVEQPEESAGKVAMHGVQATSAAAME